MSSSAANARNSSTLYQPSSVTNRTDVPQQYSTRVAPLVACLGSSTKRHLVVMPMAHSQPRSHTSLTSRYDVQAWVMGSFRVSLKC